ncbi:MAG: glycoside hydrolase family 27 protein [Oscillospiraceae bacterium]|nr:glycoside hydrolase family 27 protein [Oscillospiraceae bacterium]
MLAKTPPMGWNSWDCYGASVTEDIVRQNADYMAKHLKQYGWEYIVVDIQWFQPTADNHEYKPFADLAMDEYSRLLPAENRFPSAKNGAGFKALGEYIHSLGLKLGIHIMRGIPRQAAHRNTKIKGIDLTARDIALPNSICQWNPDMYGVNPDSKGAKEYYNSLFELYAEWGVDFVKVDDIAREFHVGEINLIRQAIDNCGREIVLSISPGASPIEHAEYFKENVNMWRITDDFWDRWDLLLDMFERAQKWCTHAVPGHFPDADMLPVGAINQCYSKDAWTKFTKDEQVTMMTLWCIMRSPLMIGGELTKCDEFTLNLLTNADLLEMLNNSWCARQVYRRDDTIVWTAVQKNGGNYLAVFNIADEAKIISVELTKCGLDGEYNAFELWSKDKSVLKETLTVNINPHGVKIFKFD